MPDPITRPTSQGDHILRWPGPPSLTVQLMPERAVYWPAERTLFAADLHIGKAAVFRARGLPVPQGTTTQTLQRLSQALQRSGAERLVVLGDLLHAHESHAEPTMAALQRWRQAHATLDCLVLEGNHDRHAGALQASLRFTALQGHYQTDALVGVHEPPASKPAAEHRLVLAGHVHPVVRLQGRIDRLRLPCFWLHEGVLTLPAFGDFTGGHLVGAPRGNRAAPPPAPGQAFVIAQDVVVALPPA